MKSGAKTLLAAIMAVGMASAFAQNTATIHSRQSLSVASTANMESIQPMTGVSSQDRSFMNAIAITHIAEVKLGQLAQQKGGDWAKAFGKDMEREHGLAREELKKVAEGTGIALPNDLPKDARAMYSKLSNLDGATFDEAYRQMMIAGHQKVLATVQTEIRFGHNEQIRNYAVIMETAVKVHLKAAREITTMMGPGGG